MSDTERITRISGTADAPAARCVRVTIHATGQTFDLVGLSAELVALIAATSLSERSLRLLLMLVAIEPTFARMRTGRLEVDVSRGKLHPYLRESLPRVDFDEAGG